MGSWGLIGKGHARAAIRMMEQKPKGYDAGMPRFTMRVERDFYPKSEAPQAPKGKARAYKPKPMEVKIVAAKPGILGKSGRRK